MQALEAIKIILGMGSSLSGRLLLFDGMTSTFRNIKLREKSSKCDVCCEPRKISSLIDYEQFCNMRASDKDFKLQLLPTEHRITVQKLNELRHQPHLLIDVRTENEYEICHLNQSENFPIKIFTGLSNKKRQELLERVKRENIPNVYVICRRGNDSQIAADKLLNELKGLEVEIYDVIGGLHAWTEHIDSFFPKY